MVYPGEVLKLGSKGEPIKFLKAKLNDLGYEPQLDPNNDVFGEVTETVVKSFQYHNQLRDDGIVGRLSWDRLISPRVNQPVKSQVLRIRALQIMNTQLFVREKTGKNDGKEVEAYLKSIGLGAGYPWCQASVYWCYDLAAKQLSMVNPVPKTGGVLECLRQAKAKGYRIILDPEQYMQGDQFIMDYGGGKGHTGLIEAKVLTNVYTIEGNTNDEGSRDGNGMFERSRAARLFKCAIRYE